MAKRGMLPKIRPAVAEAARPAIRPVKHSPPPPPPAPPTRRFPSGIAAKNEPMNVVPLDFEVDVEDDGRMTAVAPWTEPPTNPTAEPAPRHRTNVVSFEDETQARPADEYLLQSMRAEDRGAHEKSDLDVAYESLPSLEARRPFDTYEAEFAERDPVTQMVAAHESIRLRRAKQPPVEEKSYSESPYDQQQYDEPATQREDSGPRARPSEYASPPPPYDDPHESYQSGPQERGWSEQVPQMTEIPPAPPVPREMRFHTPPAFIQGVQPIRPANNHTPMPGQMPVQQYPTAPPMFNQMPQRMVPTAPPSQQLMYPVGAQIQAPKSNGIARFAWFVFGAAFGIAFAFFATGWAPHFGGEKEPLFPPPPPRPTAALTAPPTVVTAPPPPATTVVAPPPPVATTTTAAAPPPPPKPAVATAKAPPRRFFAPPRRPSSPPSDNAPKKIGADAPDPPSGGGGASVDSILGDALKP